MMINIIQFFSIQCALLLTPKRIIIILYTRILQSTILEYYTELDQF